MTPLCYISSGITFLYVILPCLTSSLNRCLLSSFNELYILFVRSFTMKYYTLHFEIAGCGVSIGKLGPGLGAQRRVVGGDEAGFGSFPWQVSYNHFT